MPLQVFIKVLAWRFSEFCLKTFGEVRVIGKAYHVHHFGNGKLLLLQQHGRLFHPDRFDVFHWRHSGQLFNFPVNLLITDTG